MYVSATPESAPRETFVSPVLGWSVEAVGIQRIRSGSRLRWGSPEDASRETSFGDVSGTGSTRSACFRAADDVCRPPARTQPVDSHEGNASDRRDASPGRRGTERLATRSRPPAVWHPTLVSTLPSDEKGSNRARNRWLTAAGRGVTQTRVFDDDRCRQLSPVDCRSRDARCLLGEAPAHFAERYRQCVLGKVEDGLGGCSPRIWSDRALSRGARPRKGAGLGSARLRVFHVKHGAQRPLALT